MSWPAGTVPADVSALRDMIVASASFTAAGGTQGKVHYPAVDQTTMTFPAALITRETSERQPYAAGAGALPTGSFRIDLYISGALAGDAEDLANKVTQEIAAQQTGLAIRSCRAGIASDPMPMELAAVADSDAQSFCIVPITLEHGLTV